MNNNDTISRQAAIDAVDKYIDQFDCLDVNFLDGLKTAKKLMMQMPSAQPVPCEDAVSRESVLDAIDEWKEACLDSGHKETVSDIKLIRKDFIELPSVTPKQRTGKWVPSDSQCGIQCLICGVPVDDFCYSIDYIDLDYIPNFCPNCGAKMEEKVYE